MSLPGLLCKIKLFNVRRKRRRCHPVVNEWELFNCFNVNICDTGSNLMTLSFFLGTMNFCFPSFHSHWKSFINEFHLFMSHKNLPRNCDRCEIITVALSDLRASLFTNLEMDENDFPLDIFFSHQMERMRRMIWSCSVRI